MGITRIYSKFGINKQKKKKEKKRERKIKLTHDATQILDKVFFCEPLERVVDSSIIFLVQDAYERMQYMLLHL